MEHSSSNIKRFRIFSQKKKGSFSYISGNRTLHFSAQARKNEKDPP